MNYWDLLINEPALSNMRKQRAQPYIFQTVSKALLAEKEAEGWELNKELKQSVSLKKRKLPSVQFEDDVWCLLAGLGFTEMNKDSNFKIQYDPEDPNGAHQVDVFAVDSECVLVIECKATTSIKRGNFKEDIESWRGIKAEVINVIKHQYPGRKIKFIFATQNYSLSSPDIERLRSAGFMHFDERDIKYYRELVKHLGQCAKYQLLGYLFNGEKIAKMDSRVLAIRGQMGGKTYYSFSIEPNRLLKIGYILHKNNPDKDSEIVQSYQRLIKKDRLKSIRSFINKGGFFPNSIIINIARKPNQLVFETSGQKIDDSGIRSGILHLPQEYRSAYIIDGQHRIYGYAGSDYTCKNSIPVIAFVDLPEKEQLQLFIDINENQKRVNKNLRVTLEDDLYWNSKDKNLQRQALRSRIARKLGEDSGSPLYNRVLIGEDSEKTAVCCIAMKSITDALSSSSFFTKYGKENTVIHGTFDREDVSATYDAFYPFLLGCFEIIRAAVESEWDKGSENDGILTINIGIYALIKTINDIVEYLMHKRVLFPTTSDHKDMVEIVSPYIQPLIQFYKRITPKEREELKKVKGSGGQSGYWHTLQQEVNKSYPDFLPFGLEDWATSKLKLYNKETFSMIHEISDHVSSDIRERLINHYGQTWFTESIPKAVYDRISKAATDYSFNNSMGLSKEPWDFITMSDCKSVVTKSGNWSEIFESDYTEPKYNKTRAKKDVKAEWLNWLSKLSRQNEEKYSISEDEYKGVKDIYNWLILRLPSTES